MLHDRADSCCNTVRRSEFLTACAGLLGGHGCPNSEELTLLFDILDPHGTGVVRLQDFATLVGVNAEAILQNPCRPDGGCTGNSCLEYPTEATSSSLKVVSPSLLPEATSPKDEPCDTLVHSPAARDPLLATCTRAFSPTLLVPTASSQTGVSVVDDA